MRRNNRSFTGKFSRPQWRRKADGDVPRMDKKRRIKVRIKKRILERNIDHKLVIDMLANKGG
jgi:hypothetical protein